MGSEDLPVICDTVSLSLGSGTTLLILAQGREDDMKLWN